MKKRRVLGIDCGTAIVGWAVLEKEGGVYNVINYGDIRTKAGTEISARLNEIHSAINNLIIEYKPTDLAVEDIFFFKNQKTIITVSEARGVILLSGAVHGLNVAGYTPLQVKMAVTGYGRAEKSQVQMMVYKILKLKDIPKCDDTADALAISFCHLNSVRK
jgi:crossover junction endodeoxyribonuclease RuvC